MNGIERAVAILGSNANLARAIGRRPQEVAKWLKRGWVPAKYCGVIAEVVPVAIPMAHVYGIAQDVARPVTLKELNPDLPDVLPARTAEVEGA